MYALIFTEREDAAEYHKATGQSVFVHPRGYQVMFAKKLMACAAFPKAVVCCKASPKSDVTIGRAVRPATCVMMKEAKTI